MLRILIADGHEIERRGVRSIVEAHPDWIVVGEAADSSGALEVAVRERPDIAILEASLTLLHGETLIERLQREAPQVRVLLFADSEDLATSRSLTSNVVGCVLKTDSEHRLEAAIEAFGREAAGEGARGPAFTARELEITRLVAAGQSNKQIARRLAISIKTVETHRSAAMRKAEVHTAVDLVRYALKHNLIHL